MGRHRGVADACEAQQDVTHRPRVAPASEVLQTVYFQTPGQESLVDAADQFRSLGRHGVEGTVAHPHQAGRGGLRLETEVLERTAAQGVAEGGRGGQ
jgi:hypothetical protein